MHLRAGLPHLLAAEAVHLSAGLPHLLAAEAVQLSAGLPHLLTATYLRQLRTKVAGLPQLFRRQK